MGIAQEHGKKKKGGVPGWNAFDKTTSLPPSLPPSPPTLSLLLSFACRNATGSPVVHSTTARRVEKSSAVGLPVSRQVLKPTTEAMWCSQRVGMNPPSVTRAETSISKMR